MNRSSYIPGVTQVGRNWGRQRRIVTGVPSIPTGLTPSAGDNQVALTWNPNPSNELVDLYQVYLNDQNYDLAVAGTSKVVTGLTNGTSYSFRVGAHNSSGYSAWSSAVNSTPTAPSGQFGALLPARLIESPGSVVNVSTLSALTSALSSASNGSIINITSSLNGGGVAYTITRNATSAAPIMITSSPGVLLTNFAMIEVRGSYLRFRGLDVGFGTIDGIKINVSANNIEVDHCLIHNAALNGINIQDSPANIQIWNNRVWSNGGNTNQDHGIYFGHANGQCVVANNVFYDNQAYGIQLYPQANDVICVCNTVDGGVTRGGTVVGSESGLTDNVTIVGMIGTNAPWYCIDLYDPASGDTGNNTYDSLGFGNGSGDFRAGTGMTYTNCTHADPLYVNRAAKNFTLQSGSPAINKIQSARYGYVPPTDIDGKVRVTADAGAFAF